MNEPILFDDLPQNTPLEFALDYLEDTGLHLGALYIKNSKCYFECLESIGLTRTNAQAYRDLACYAPLLRDDPKFFGGMTIADALMLVERYKAIARGQE